MSTASRAKSEVDYPESDGEPMGETGFHVHSTLDLFFALNRNLFGGRPDVFVAADMFFYYEEGNPAAVKAPDIMVIKGVSHAEERRTFKLWVEGVAPSVIFEITSAKTRRDDVVVNRELYARLGVAEYYLFDPLGEYLQPRFRALRLVGVEYVEIPPNPRDGSFDSPELGVRLLAVGPRVHVLDRITGDKYISGDDLGTVFELRKDHRRDLAVGRKEREKLIRQASREKKKADAERLRADALEAELNRLRALLGDGGKPPEA